MCHLNNAPDLTGLNGIPSTPSMNPMEGSQAVQQNPNPIIFFKGVEVGKELSMSAAHSNIARLVTKNENGATGIADIVNKKFTEDITLSSALEKLESAQDYNEDMKAVVLKSIEKASTNEDKIAVLEKGLAFLETEKKLSECVQSGKMELDEAKALLTKSLDFGCSKDFSLEKLNEFNEFSTNEQDGSTIQQKASEVFGTEVSTVSSPVNNDQSQPQSTNQPPEDRKVSPEKTNHSSISKTIDTKVFNESEFGEKFEKVVTTPQQQRNSEPKSAPLHASKPQPEIVNQSVMELINKPSEQPQGVKEKILTIAKSASYKAEKSSSKRRQMILTSLPEQMDSATLDSILKDERCSRGVKVALLDSDKLPMFQKLQVLQSPNAKGVDEIIKYCNEHKNLEKIKKLAETYSNNKKFIDNRKDNLINELIKDTIPGSDFLNFSVSKKLEELKDFFNPSAFTSEEREKIIKDLTFYKETYPNEDMVYTKIDMMIAQFTEPWDVSFEKTLQCFSTVKDDALKLLNELEKEEKEVPTNNYNGTLKITVLKNPEKLDKIHTLVSELSSMYNIFSANEDNETLKLMQAKTGPQTFIGLKDILNDLKKTDSANSDVNKKIENDFSNLMTEQDLKNQILIAKGFLDKNQKLIEYTNKKAWSFGSMNNSQFETVAQFLESNK